jgi:hypothetical protein
MSDNDIRRIGSIFITNLQKLEDFVTAFQQLRQSDVFCRLAMGILPHTWQAQMVTQNTELGRKYLRGDAMDMNQLAYHIAALVEMPGRWFDFRPINRRVEKDFFTSCSSEAAALKAEMGWSWDRSEDPNLPHWRCANEPAFESDVTDEEIQQAMDEYAAQDSKLWEVILRRLGSGGTTMQRFMGIVSDPVDPTKIPKHAVDPLSIALIWMGLLPDPDEDSFNNPFVQEALAHGKTFEPMNVSGAVQIFNHGVPEGQPKYIHRSINMIMVPQCGRLFWISPDGSIERDAYDSIDADTGEIIYHHPAQRIAFEAKCQYKKKSVYYTCPENRYLAQVLAEMEALKTPTGLASFMFYRKKEDSDYSGWKEGDCVEVTLELIHADAFSRSAFKQLLATCAYYLQLVNMEMLSMLSYQAAGEHYENCKKARLNIQQVLVQLRKKMEHAISIGRHKQDLTATQPRYMTPEELEQEMAEIEQSRLLRDDPILNRTGVKKEFVRFRRSCPFTEPAYHNQVVQLCAARLDIFVEYFGGDRSLCDKWKGKSYHDFDTVKPKDVKPKTYISDSATASAMRHREEWSTCIEKLREIVQHCYNPAQKKKRVKKTLEQIAAAADKVKKSKARTRVV